jgi:myo-inositol-hexaphosphate 3-phosphohydrolase
MGSIWLHQQQGVLDLLHVCQHDVGELLQYHVVPQGVGRGKVIRQEVFVVLAFQAERDGLLCDLRRGERMIVREEV